MTANASPDPVKKGKTVKVTGSLTRADWETLTYRGYGDKSVKFQWRSTKGSYRPLKTVTSTSEGTLKSTIKATRDGCFRYVFMGSTNTAPVTSAGDCIDVK